MAHPDVSKVPELPTRGVPVKRWAVDTTLAVRALVGGIVPPVPTQETPVGVRLQAMQVVSEQNDHLVCRSLGADGAIYGSDINVAKPYLLRRTPFDGLARNSITYTYSAANVRLADDDTDTETQVIVPSYVVGDTVYGVSVQPDAGVVVDGAALRFIDLNLDGRAWAKQSE